MKEQIGSNSIEKTKSLLQLDKQLIDGIAKKVKNSSKFSFFTRKCNHKSPFSCTVTLIHFANFVSFDNLNSKKQWKESPTVNSEVLNKPRSNKNIYGDGDGDSTLLTPQINNLARTKIQM